MRQITLKTYLSKLKEQILWIIVEILSNRPIQNITRQIKHKHVLCDLYLKSL